MQDLKKDEYLFVYGTLRHKVGHPMCRVLAGHAALIGPATFQGCLYAVAHYPGAVPSAMAGDLVHGEVYLLKDPAVVLAALDAYEECSPDFPMPHEYRRELKEVKMLHNAIIPAWTYIYIRPTEQLPRIASGDFLDADAEIP